MVTALNPYSGYSTASDVDGSQRADGSAISNTKNVAEDSRSTSTLVRSFPGQKTTRPDGTSRDKVELSREAQEICELQMRDREVRAHEAAHAAAGGVYAGSPTYTFERGADGHSYAVGGSVSIDTSPIKGDPQATLQKAEQVRSAALAPAQPSAQDMKIAQKAQMMAAEARMEIVQQHQPTESLSHSFTPDFLPAGQNRSESNSQEAPENDSSYISVGISRLDIYS